MAGIPVPFGKYIIILPLFTNSFILCSLKELFPVGVNPKVDFFSSNFPIHIPYGIPENDFVFFQRCIHLYKFFPGPLCGLVLALGWNRYNELEWERVTRNDYEDLLSIILIKLFWERSGQNKRFPPEKRFLRSECLRKLNDPSFW